MQETTILIVDDLESYVKLLTDIVKELGFKVATARNGVEALAGMRTCRPDLVLLDVEMPVMNGFEVLEHVRDDQVLSRIPIILVTGLADADSMAKGLKLGAYDYVVKPFNSTILKARIDYALRRKELQDIEYYYSRSITTQNVELRGRVIEQVKDIDSAQRALIFAMSKLTEYRDEATGSHLQRIREYCRLVTGHLIGLRVGRDVIDEQYVDFVYQASPLHDIGKVGVPDHILLKPGKLTHDEFEMIKPHTTIGANTLRAVQKEYSQSKLLAFGIEICESHHENWDGTGFPKGLAGPKIPLTGRIVTICDVYDALRSRRPYKEPFDHETAVNMILEQVETKFDPQIVGIFTKCAPEFDRISRTLGE